MKRIYLFLCLGLAFVGCTEDIGVEEVRYQPAKIVAAAMEKLDANKNGSLEGSELEAAPGFKAALALGDANRDQALSAVEIENRAKVYAGNNLIYPVSLRLQWNGAPLSHADVKFIPEQPFDQLIKSATGKTDEWGNTLLRCEGVPISGVYPGLYRVEVSRKDAAGQEQLPAANNTHTTLGVEIAIDVPNLERGIVLELKGK
jgi:hypothetical protein